MSSIRLGLSEVDRVGGKQRKSIKQVKLNTDKSRYKKKK